MVYGLGITCPERRSAGSLFNQDMQMPDGDAEMLDVNLKGTPRANQWEGRVVTENHRNTAWSNPD